MLLSSGGYHLHYIVARHYEECHLSQRAVYFAIASFLITFGYSGARDKANDIKKFAKNYWIVCPFAERMKSETDFEILKSKYYNAKNEVASIKQAYSITHNNTLLNMLKNTTVKCDNLESEFQLQQNLYQECVEFNEKHIRNLYSKKLKNYRFIYAIVIGIYFVIPFSLLIISSLKEKTPKQIAPFYYNIFLCFLCFLTQLLIIFYMYHENFDK